MHRRGVLYSDETSTGAEQPRLRGLRRITIGARCPGNSDNFDWILKFKHDYLASNQEPKSTSVIHACTLIPKARDFIRRNVCESTIFVIDVFSELCALSNFLFDIAPDPKNTLKSIVASGVVPEPQLRDWLLSERKLAILRTAIPRVEFLIAEIGINNEHGEPINLLTDTKISELLNPVKLTSSVRDGRCHEA